MRLHKKLIYSFICLICFCIQNQNLSAQSSNQDKIDSRVFETLDNQKWADCLISFKKKTDLSGARSLKNKEEKGLFVYNALYATSQRSQKQTIDYLQNENISFSSYYLVNAIAAKLNKEQVIYLSEIDAISNISLDPGVRLDNIQSSGFAKNNADAEWGIQMINADSVWTMGFEGQGVVIAGQDTGYEWEHSVLKSKYRGYADTIAEHNYNWHDAIFEINPMHNDSVADASANPCGLSVPYPCDDHNHGTHTMGTMVGSDSMNLIGVAPMSKWIACRNMDRGIGKPSTYIECFEWFLAPTDLEGLEPRPDLAPDVINNSWSCPEDEGCNESNWALMQEAIANLKAAGIVVVVSAGNDGRFGCATIAKPPAMFEESFAVGATRSDDLIADFSSRGPVAIDSSFRLKPDVSAPGQNVRSCIRNGGFANFSGTSMAGPHVAGAVALIISANPELRGQVETIESILRNSAVQIIDSTDCFGVSGLSIPNHVYGHGRIDVLKAVEMARAISSSEDLPLASNNIKVYPNPSSDIIHIQTDLISPDVEAMLTNIYDNQGRLLRSIRGIATVVDVSELEAGLYVLRIQSKDISSTARFIIAR